MAKVYFYHATMNSGKSAQMMMNINQYERNGYHVDTFVPRIGARENINEDGNTVIESRVGLKEPAYAINRDELVSELVWSKANVIFIDEAQFLTKEQVEDLFYLATMNDIAVICYGLLTNFKTELFEGSKRLIELGAKLQEIKAIGKLGEKPVVNSLFIDGKIQTEGAEVQLGREESYKTLTLRQYWEEIGRI